MVQRDISPNYNLEKLVREAEHNWPQRRKTKTGNSPILGSTERESSGLDQITTQS